MATIYKGDDTGAFGNTFITVYLENTGYTISKAIFVCGCIKKEYINPSFPLTINLSTAETKKLNMSNACYLVVYDSEGRQATCEGTLTFGAKNGVI